jgi:hypothetical protein
MLVSRLALIYNNVTYYFFRVLSAAFLLRSAFRVQKEIKYPNECRERRKEH